LIKAVEGRSDIASYSANVLSLQPEAEHISSLRIKPQALDRSERLVFNQGLNIANIPPYAGNLKVG
jgi:hypothetical protein